MSGTKFATSEPWRVGVLFSRTGFMSIIEETQLKGTLLAIDEINAAGGVLGRELTAVAYDPGSESPAFGHFAKRLMVEDGVSTIFGCYTSSSRKAVLPVVERLNGLLWYPTLYEGFEASPNVIYTGAAPNQNSSALCDFLIETFGSRFFFVGSDYIYPRETNRVMRDLLRGRATVVGERYFSLRARHSDFLPLMQELRRVKPDVIFSTIVGEGTVHFYQAYADAGFDPKTMPIASLTTTEAEVRSMGFDVAEGHITSAPYFQGAGGRAAAAFVQRYKKRFGESEATNMCVEAAYFQVFLFAKALERAGTLDTDVLRAAALGVSIDAPQGEVAIDPVSGHTDLWTRVGRVNGKGLFDIVRESASPVHADPFLVSSARAAVGVRG